MILFKVGRIRTSQKDVNLYTRGRKNRNRLKIYRKYSCSFLKGRLDALGARELEDKLTRIITQNLSTLIIDFQQVDYLSSAGIRVLLSFYKRLKKEEKSLKLTSLSSFPLQVLEIAGLTDVFSIKTNLKEALEEVVEIEKRKKIISRWENYPGISEMVEFILFYQKEKLLPG